MTPAEPLAAGSVSLRLYPHDAGSCEQVELIRHQASSAASAGYDGVMVSEHHADFPGYMPNPMQLAGILLAAMPKGWAAPCPLLSTIGAVRERPLDQSVVDAGRGDLLVDVEREREL